MLANHANPAITLGTVQQAQQLLDPICELYDEVFSGPPFVWPDTESADHRKMLNRLVFEPSFGIALAQSVESLVGFAYGYMLHVDTHWWEGFSEPVPAELTEERPGRTFAVIDLAVRADWRRHGIGRRLLACLLDSRTEERATLAVQPQADVSHKFYKAIGGWTYIGRQNTPGYVSPAFDIYMRRLPKP